MKINPEQEEFVLSSGRRIVATNLILGLDPELTLHEGFEGFVAEVEDLKPDERAEIADYAIELWNQFKNWRKI